MARREYPSDEARRKNKPAVRIHHSITWHRRMAPIYADNDLLAVWTRIMVMASIAHAGKTDDWLTIPATALMQVTNRTRTGAAQATIKRLTSMLQWEYRQAPGCVQVRVRNFGRKQGFPSAITPQAAEHDSATPHPSESESESESEEEKKIAPTALVNEAGKNGSPTRPQKPEVSQEEILEAWRAICVPLGAPDIRELTPDRRRRLAQRLREHPRFEWWDELFKRVSRSRFLFGSGDRGWRISIDWLIANGTNGTKILEGKYDEQIPRSLRTGSTYHPA